MKPWGKLSPSCGQGAEFGPAEPELAVSDAGLGGEARQQEGREKGDTMQAAAPQLEGNHWGQGHLTSHVFLVGLPAFGARYMQGLGIWNGDMGQPTSLVLWPQAAHVPVVGK